MFHDDLLIRATSGYELTPQGERLLGELEVMLPKLDRLLSGSSFDPSTEQATFRIAATDNAAAVLAPLLCRNILPGAEKVRIDFLPWHTGVYDQLAHGRIDLAMAASIVDVPPPLQSQMIYNEDFLCAVDAKSPYKRALTIGQYMKAEHLSIAIQSGIQVVPDKPLAAKGYKRKVAMQLPYHEAAIRCVPGTHYIATVPRRFVEGATPNPAIRFLKPPPEVSSFRYVMTWHPRVNTDAAHSWFRETMRQLGASLSY
jgi:DNA-binding transcriptional LysR family regulator